MNASPLTALRQKEAWCVGEQLALFDRAADDATALFFTERREPFYIETSNIWTVKNNRRGTNSNRIVVLRKD